VSVKVQEMMSNSYVRAYTNSDVVGVEIGGALKNVIAIAAGLVDGLSFGDNTKAALITRGLIEIIRLGKKMGAQPMTFMGLAGVGDLIVTCISQHSRNWKAGYSISQGKTLKEVLHTMGMVVEGVEATNAAYALSKKYGVDMPLTEELFYVLFEQKNPSKAVTDLMMRENTNEFDKFF
jgi:glycerol-3-phosphate dehydrogenase (NAD(P)+)